MQNKIELDFDDKLKFFKIPIILFPISAFCLFNGLTNISNYSINELNNVPNKIGILLFLLALLLFIKQWNNLKFIKISCIIDISHFKQMLCEFVETKKWKINFLSDNYAIIETVSAGSDGRYFLAKSYGEVIHIKIAKNEIYLTSIFDVNKNVFITISTGENSSNEKMIEKLITSLDKGQT